MFRNLRLKGYIRQNAGAIRTIRDGLIHNLMLDAHFETFPQLPPPSSKQHLKLVGYDVLFREFQRLDANGELAAHFSLRVKIGDWTIGTLRISGSEKIPDVILPMRDKTSTEFKRFLKALQEIAEADQNMREEPRKYEA